jgi:hypothetical protein
VSIPSLGLGRHCEPILHSLEVAALAVRPASELFFMGLLAENTSTVSLLAGVLGLEQGHAKKHRA